MAEAAASTDKTKKAAEEAGKVSEKASKSSTEAAQKHRASTGQRLSRSAPLRLLQARRPWLASGCR